MPAFFAISGFLYNESKGLNLKRYVFSKVKTLLIPYLCFSLSALILYMALGWNDGNYLDIYNRVQYILNGTPGCYSLPLWFLYTLFQVSVIYALLKKFLKYKVLIILVGLASLVGGYICFEYGIKPLFHIDTLLTSFFFYMIGHQIRTICKDIKINIFLLIAFLLVASISFIICVNQPNYYPDLLLNKLYNNLITYLIATLSGISLMVILVYLCSMLKDLLYIGQLLRFISSNAISILGIHYIIVFICQQYRLPSLITVIISLSICLLIAPFFNKYLPFYVGKSNITGVR